MSTSGAQGIGLAFAHFAGLTDVLAGIGGAFMMIYSPIKSFVLGCDTHLLPKKLTKLNDKGMPANAMWLQAVVVIAIIFICCLWWGCSQHILYRFDRYDECFISCSVSVLDWGFPVLQDEKRY